MFSGKRAKGKHLQKAGDSQQPVGEDRSQVQSHDTFSTSEVSTGSGMASIFAVAVGLGALLSWYIRCLKEVCPGHTCLCQESPSTACWTSYSATKH
jgi:hypothetical protein